MDRDDLIRRLADLRPRFEAEGVRHLAVFGSRARGDNRPDSDLDILVDISPLIRFSVLDLIEIQFIVERETGLQANAVVRRGISDRFREEIRNDIVEVF